VSKIAAKKGLANLIAALAASLILSSGCGEPISPPEIDYANCLSCHKGIEKISKNHNLECAVCHINPGDRSNNKLATHKQIIRNPSDFAHVDTFCLPCHQKEIAEVRHSLHSSMAGIINQTRFLWGAQKRAAPAIYGLSGPFQPLPEPASSVYPEAPEMLVDDFLRRRCLRCHIHTTGAGAPGLYRSTGCAACHVVYQNDGRYRGNDKAIDKSKSGYPVLHLFTTRIPNLQCLHCHNQNHVGADYEGLFEHDYSRTYRSPIKEGVPAAMIYGLDHHRLAKDIHAERGLWCIDCHGRKDVMGNGEAYSYEMEVPKRVCPDCHGGYDKRESGVFLLISKNNGKEHRIPQFSPDSVGHNIEAHRRLRCSACHAQWSYQDYGLSVIREDLIDSDKWQDLTSQGDPYLEKILKKYLESPGIGDPVSKDWLSGKPGLGIWSAGWRFRRWEFMPLGVDSTNRYAILRPLYQYLISYVDRLGNIPLDSVIPLRGDGSGRGWAFMPYVPHTTAPAGRRCESCHLSRVAAGLGIQEEDTVDTSLAIPSPPAVETMRLLSAQERKMLLEPSERWYKKRRDVHL